MRPLFLRYAALAAATAFTLVGCGDDDKSTTKKDTSGGSDTTQNDTNQNDTNQNDTNQNDTNQNDTNQNDTNTSNCGTRECGTFGGTNCGTCASKPGTVCSVAGRCEVPGAPLGGFCGITSTCKPDGANFPACLNDQCEAGTCLSATSTEEFRLVFLRDLSTLFANSVCTQSCMIYKDANNDGVNDADQEDDCNPPDIVDGSAGNSFRCVNFAKSSASSPLGLCVPGTTFKECESNSDCPTGEGCQITSILGTLNARCVANNQGGTWGETVSLGVACNSDPAAGDVTYCETGYCERYGCTDLCTTDAQCDTTTGSGVCKEGACEGKPGTTCVTDADCSSFACKEFDLGTGSPIHTCGPKDCADEMGCGPGFTCAWGWNGSVLHPKMENACSAEVVGGAELGEACDPDPTDNEVVNGGVTCKSDLCLGERCSQVCSSDSQCGTDGLCTMYEFTADFKSCTKDADCGAGNKCSGDTTQDGACYNGTTGQYIRTDADTFALPLHFCGDFTGATSSCLATSDCQTTERCELYLALNTTDVDAPYLLAGKCVPVEGFAADEGVFGDNCLTSADCRSGFCLGANAAANQAGFCTEPCTASEQCGAIDAGDEGTFHGICNTYVYSTAGNYNHAETYNYVGLCIPDAGSAADCSSDFACDAATEVCYPNALTNNATEAATVEYLCVQMWDDAADAGTKTLGVACNPSAENNECASGICIAEGGSETVGYCSALCNQPGDGDPDPCGNGTECTDVVRYPRGGAYAANSGTYALCQKPAPVTP